MASSFASSFGRVLHHPPILRLNVRWYGPFKDLPEHWFFLLTEHMRPEGRLRIGCNQAQDKNDCVFRHQRDHLRQAEPLRLTVELADALDEESSL
ncbi:hypothetical protein NDU88_001006 [Pleurodeles waltl]|uniref:Uncharacterized protein n=1 Tax=Pleurodeles waltl TaxID=8319 RepID=A0AAV7Q8U3_PLEWA|nr:hypothetical protein NDU88_001006 [Pleurodeles waltl]